MKWTTLLLCLLSLPALAIDGKFSAMVSVLGTKPDIDGVDELGGVDEKFGMTGGIGMRALLKIHDAFNFRTGLGIRQKDLNYDVETAAGDTEVEGTLTYFSLPLTLHFPVQEDLVGFFIGSAADLLIDDECEVSGATDDCTLEDEKSAVFPLVVGFEVSPTDRWGFELSYEHGITESAKDTKTHSYVGSFLYHF